MKQLVKKHIVTLMLMLLAVISTNASEKRAYVWYDEYSYTLTFSYDDEYRFRMALFIDEETVGVVGLFYYTYRTFPNLHIDTVVFDASFAEFRPRLTIDWFAESYSLGHEDPALQKFVGLENLNPSEVTSMEGMFRDCCCLTSLDLSSWNTSLVEGLDMSEMFSGCMNLKTIYVGKKWSIDYVYDSHNMFYECTSLVGGEGTVFDPEQTSAAYAHVDGGPNNPGYFTLKVSQSTEIEKVLHPNAYGEMTNNEVQTFGVDGKRLSNLRRGMKIVQQAEGTVKKVMVK